IISAAFRALRHFLRTGLFHWPQSLYAEVRFEGDGGLQVSRTLKVLHNRLKDPAILDDVSDTREPGRQVRRVLRVLPKLRSFDGQLRYPGGRVPDDVPTETVRQQVIEFLDHEARELGLTGNDKPNDPSWDTVHRALGRAQ